MVNAEHAEIRRDNKIVDNRTFRAKLVEAFEAALKSLGPTKAVFQNQF
jgi:hypothetical protein